uniref:Protein PFC0760c-like n=1 Tax=Dermatophagoides pteronyssinus TaxID=6956 RepID=A0A6P6YD19_DERPT|nr:protein PFC0760c-like [Dermatophagoides pteronyssinus]
MVDEKPFPAPNFARELKHDDLIKSHLHPHSSDDHIYAVPIKVRKAAISNSSTPKSTKKPIQEQRFKVLETNEHLVNSEHNMVDEKPFPVPNFAQELKHDAHHDDLIESPSDPHSTSQLEMVDNLLDFTSKLTNKTTKEILDKMGQIAKKIHSNELVIGNPKISYKKKKELIRKNEKLNKELIYYKNFVQHKASGLSTYDKRIEQDLRDPTKPKYMKDESAKTKMYFLSDIIELAYEAKERYNINLLKYLKNTIGKDDDQDNDENELDDPKSQSDEDRSSLSSKDTEFDYHPDNEINKKKKHHKRVKGFFKTGKYKLNHEGSIHSNADSDSSTQTETPSVTGNGEIHISDDEIHTSDDEIHTNDDEIHTNDDEIHTNDDETKGLKNSKDNEHDNDDIEKKNFFKKVKGVLKPFKKSSKKIKNNFNKNTDNPSNNDQYAELNGLDETDSNDHTTNVADEILNFKKNANLDDEENLLLQNSLTRRKTRNKRSESPAQSDINVDDEQENDEDEMYSSDISTPSNDNNDTQSLQEQEIHKKTLNRKYPSQKDFRHQEELNKNYIFDENQQKMPVLPISNPIYGDDKKPNENTPLKDEYMDNFREDHMPNKDSLQLQNMKRCGGLCSGLASILAGVGVGFIRLIDDDLVSESNLHRQLLFGYDSLEQIVEEIENQVMNKSQSCSRSGVLSNIPNIIGSLMSSEVVKLLLSWKSNYNYLTYDMRNLTTPIRNICDKFS